VGHHYAAKRARQITCSKDTISVDFRPNGAKRVWEKVFGNDACKKYKDNKIIKF
jgi:hypothetical protein